MWIYINVMSELYTVQVDIITCIPEHHLVSVWRHLSDSSAAQLPVARSNGHGSTPEWLSPGHVIDSGVLQCCPIIKHHKNKIIWDMRPEIQWDETLFLITWLSSSFPHLILSCYAISPHTHPELYMCSMLLSSNTFLEVLSLSLRNNVLLFNRYILCSNFLHTSFYSASYYMHFEPGNIIYICSDCSVSPHICKCD